MEPVSFIAVVALSVVAVASFKNFVRHPLTFLGNTLWFLFGGITGLYFYLLGIVAYLTVVGIPLGRVLFKVGRVHVFPFDVELSVYPLGRTGSNPITLFLNIAWCLLFGWEAAGVHLGLALACAVTIVGIPFALQHLKLVAISLAPFGSELTYTNSRRHQRQQRESPARARDRRAANRRDQ